MNNCYAIVEANKGNYTYCSRYDVSLYIDTDSYREYNNLTDFVSDLKEYIQDCYMEVCGTLEANGYAELEHQDSEEYAIEAIKGNDYEFTIDGKQF